MIPAGLPGLLLIGEQVYMVTVHAELPADGSEAVVTGFRVTKATGEVYDLDPSRPWGLQCDCPDATYRPNRPGGCKHAVALRQALGEYRSLGGMARNDPEGFVQHEADVAPAFTPRAKDRHYIPGADDFDPAA
jgi:hypothetical protein